MDAMAPKAAKRKPLFERVTPRAFVLTPRDEEIIKHVAHLRCLSSDHLVALLAPGSRQKILRRLRTLFDAGYVSRPPARHRSFAGATPLPYILGNRGADLMASKFGVRRSSVSWTHKARTQTRGELDHALAVSDVMVAFELACRAQAHLDLIPFAEILETMAPAAVRESARPYHWPVSVRWQGKEEVLYVIPDRTFALRDRSRPEGRNRRGIFLEVDRGTQPIVRRTLAQSSVLRKLVGYAATYNAGLHKTTYGLPNFRVLIIVPGRKRIDTIIAAYQEHIARTVAPQLFLLADQAGLLECPHFFAYEWLDAEGQPHRLLE